MALSQLVRLLAAVRPLERVEVLAAAMTVPPIALEATGDNVSAAVLAQALAMLLFADLLERVPEGRAYVGEVVARGERVTFDHGALRTVDGPHTGSLPRGAAAFARILEPLGYARAATYDLSKLKMTGYAYRHQTAPDAIPQYFVSELHVERFSPAFASAVAAVAGHSVDPLPLSARAALADLARDGALPFATAAALLPELAGCFTRAHPTPALDAYETLLAESPEMAWIATEGNAFNHATDRVADIRALAEDQRTRGRSIKETIEVNPGQTILQTAFRAAPVEREFTTADGRFVQKTVPGSFYEFIERRRLPDGTLDLGFDSGNAQGIFTMTRGPGVSGG